MTVPHRAPGKLTAFSVHGKTKNSEVNVIDLFPIGEGADFLPLRQRQARATRKNTDSALCACFGERKGNFLHLFVNVYLSNFTAKHLFEFLFEVSVKERYRLFVKS